MSRKAVRTVFLSVFADFWVGMATAWAFAAIVALTPLSWLDLLFSLFLAILSFSLSFGIKLKIAHDKST